MTTKRATANTSSLTSAYMLTAESYRILYLADEYFQHWVPVNGRTGVTADLSMAGRTVNYCRVQVTCQKIKDKWIPWLTLFTSCKYMNMWLKQIWRHKWVQQEYTPQLHKNNCSVIYLPTAAASFKSSKLWSTHLASVNTTANSKRHSNRHTFTRLYL